MMLIKGMSITLLAELNTWFAAITVVPMPATKTCITSLVPLNMKFSIELGRPIEAMERMRGVVVASKRKLAAAGVKLEKYERTNREVRLTL